LKIGPHNKKRIKGVTLVELIISVVIIGIAFYSLINVISLVAGKSQNSRDITIASFLGMGKTEEFLATALCEDPVVYAAGTQMDPFVGNSPLGESFFNPGNPLSTTPYFQDYKYRAWIYYMEDAPPPAFPNASSILRVKSMPGEGNEYDFRLLTVQVFKTDSDGNPQFSKNFFSVLQPRILFR